MSDLLRGKLVVGNWKMNGSCATNAALLAGIVAGWQPRSGRDVVVCVPFPYLAQARDALATTRVAWGAQDVSVHAAGAYTGQVSAGMLAEFGCRYVLVGHSERRQECGETDAVVAAKAVAARREGLVPVVCFGETLAERDAGQWQAVVTRQVDAVVQRLGPDSARAVFAYEPVWAIGTGRTAAPEQAQEVHAHLRGLLRSAGAPEVPMLYGGSVKAANAGALFAQADVDGALVGGASLAATEFLAIAGA